MSANPIAPAIEIALPADVLTRLLRHPAIRALGPNRTPWEAAADGRKRRLSRIGASMEVSLFQAAGGALCLRGETAAPGDISALGAALGRQLPAQPVFRGEGGRPPAAGQTEIGAALAAAMRDGLSQLALHGPTCRADAPPTGVHQARVALRRMRSVLKLSRSALDGRLPGDDPLAACDANLKRLAAALGPARDLDVFAAGLGRLLSETLPDEPRLVPLHRRAAAARLSAYGALPPLLAGPALRAVLWQAAALIETLEAMPPRRDLHDFATRVLGKRHRRLRRAGADIETLPPAQLHALRLDGKRLRYAAEWLAPMWDSPAPRRYLRRLARLQEALGQANDAEVARGLVRQLGARGWALGLAEGLALGSAAGSRDAALRAWGKWRKAPRFWLDD